MSERSTQLTILDGGRSLPVSEMRVLFLDAYVTDTRLMGVLAVCARWTIAAPFADRNDPNSWENLSQFFYIDCEESGLETYQQVRGRNDQEAVRIEEALVCGLGGEKIELDERQLRLLLQNWAGFNREHGLPLPAGENQYGFLLDPPITASDEEQADLMKLICPQIRTDEQAINYYLMRCFGRDLEGARYMTISDQVPLELYFDYVRATFCRNSIEPTGTFPDGASEYLCESLIEMDGNYEIVVTRLVVKNLRIAAARRCSGFPISHAEAALILKKDEYIRVYEIFLSDEDLEDNIDEFTLGFHATMSEYENGRLFMIFRPTNDHVDSRIFQLSADVQGMLFLTKHRQLLLCAHELPELRRLEKTIRASVLAPYLVPGKTLHSAKPVIYDFMRSDFDHFEDYISSLLNRD
ncbi:MAG: hypothetical protein IJ128_01885 [Firmicutes bacterium]|nr:hypothetical protein [Bacillota bacterium]